MYIKIKIQKICEIYYEDDYCDVLDDCCRVICPQRVSNICVLKNGEMLDQNFKTLRYIRTDYCNKRTKKNDRNK